MPKSTWNRVLDEVNRLQIQDQQNPPQPGHASNQDRYRRGKIAAVEHISKRPLIVYASACTSPAKPVAVEMLMLDFTDKIGFKTVTDNIDSPALDILIHSPGGYAEAAESIVQQIRSKYSEVRFIIPSFAKSAATMFVMSGNEILMDRDAELGPIDPQMRTQSGTSPAESILEQFAKAQEELQTDATKLPSWVPILSPLGPSLLVDSQKAIDLSKTLVKTWTQTYMLAGDPAAEEKSNQISEYLGSHSNFKSHARAVKISQLLPLGVKVTDIRTNPKLYAAVDELYCCLDILLANSPVYKIFENSAGDALIRQSGGMIQLPAIQLPQRPTPPTRPGLRHTT
jgi:Serine dehydrogenase proteinase